MSGRNTRGHGGRPILSYTSFQPSMKTSGLGLVPCNFMQCQSKGNNFLPSCFKLKFMPLSEYLASALLSWKIAVPLPSFRVPTGSGNLEKVWKIKNTIQDLEKVWNFCHLRKMSWKGLEFFDAAKIVGAFLGNPTFHAQVYVETKSFSSAWFVINSNDKLHVCRVPYFSPRFDLNGGLEKVWKFFLWKVWEPCSFYFYCKNTFKWCHCLHKPKARVFQIPWPLQFYLLRSRTWVPVPAPPPTPSNLGVPMLVPDFQKGTLLEGTWINYDPLCRGTGVIFPPLRRDRRRPLDPFSKANKTLVDP